MKTPTSSVRDKATLTRAERESERNHRRALSQEGKPHASRVIARVQRARSNTPRQPKMRLVFNKKTPTRTRPRTAPVREFARRAFVRVRYSPAKKAGQWRAHALYLEREGAQREGGRGAGFSAGEDDVAMAVRANEWQMAGDDKVFKLVLSPEDGDRLDLKDYTRKFMARFEAQHGEKLDWMAIDHHNTDNPHVHILVRGGGVMLAPELIGKHARDIASDEATRALGYRTQKDVSLGREREIDQRRFTSIDREIQRKAVPEPGKGSFLVTESAPPPGSWQSKIDERRQRIGRLQALEKIGVAERVGHQTWRLDGGWDKALKELDVLHNRSTMLMRHRELMTDPRALPVVTKVQPGERLVGRVLGTGLDDATDSPYLLIEGSDGRAHFIRQTPGVEDRRAAGELKPGALAVVEGRTGKSGKPIVAAMGLGLEIPARGFSKVVVPDAVLDADLKHREKAGQSLPGPPASVGFAGHYQRALTDRARRVEVERKRAAADRGVGQVVEPTVTKSVEPVPGGVVEPGVTKPVEPGKGRAKDKAKGKGKGLGE